MIWVSYISPITGKRVKLKYHSEEEAIRSLQYEGGQPDTHGLKVLGPVEDEGDRPPTATTPA